jgi:hypothetical protein
MRLDLARLLGPVVAALVLVLVLQQTLGALRAAGVWGPRHTAAAPAASPFARIEGLLAPARSEPNCMPATVITGKRALRMACLQTTFQVGSPLARAVRM